MNELVAVLGLGYVGLPVAVALARVYPQTVGFDTNSRTIEQLRSGTDPTGMFSAMELQQSGIVWSSVAEDLKGCSFFIVAVPTPVDENNQPDLSFVIRASELVGTVLKPGSVVVYESTVYPGVTEEICGPTLARVSGLRQGVDFKLGYSPERINPGDQQHTLQRITKVVSAQDAESLGRVSDVYGSIVEAGIFKAPSIKVAEAAKVIENTQRDLNIALMNELAIIFDRLDIRTKDVIEAASTKWNFLRFSPGLVGGHCIGVDPYYLTAIAQRLGYRPEVILAGRRINDNMGAYIAQKLVKLLIHADVQVKGARVAVLGLTFKENVRDIRNSRVPSIVSELKQFGINPCVCDPLADPEQTFDKYGIKLMDRAELRGCDAVVLAVAHQEFLEMSVGDMLQIVKANGVLVDVKSVLDHSLFPSTLACWSL